MGSIIVKSLQLLARLLEWEYNRLLEKEEKLEAKRRKLYDETGERITAAWRETEEKQAALEAACIESVRRIHDERDAELAKTDGKWEQARAAELRDAKVLAALRPIID